MYMKDVNVVADNIELNFTNSSELRNADSPPFLKEG